MILQELQGRPTGSGEISRKLFMLEEYGKWLIASRFHEFGVPHDQPDRFQKVALTEHHWN